MPDRYEIKDGYQINAANPGSNSPAGEYQPDVYRLAVGLARSMQKNTIIDIGCGKSRLTMDIMKDFTVIGLDTPGAVEYLNKEYPARCWKAVNLDTITANVLSPDILQESVLICSDVIEHLTDPVSLIATLKDWVALSGVCVFSTPERDIERGIDHMGPPQNKLHVREWSAEEFERYLRKSGFNVGFVGLTRTNEQEKGTRAYRTIVATVHP